MWHRKQVKPVREAGKFGILRSREFTFLSMACSLILVLVLDTMSAYGIPITQTLHLHNRSVILLVFSCILLNERILSNWIMEHVNPSSHVRTIPKYHSSIEQTSHPQL